MMVAARQAYNPPPAIWLGPARALRRCQRSPSKRPLPSGLLDPRLWLTSSSYPLRRRQQGIIYNELVSTFSLERRLLRLAVLVPRDTPVPLSSKSWCVVEQAFPQTPRQSMPNNLPEPRTPAEWIEPDTAFVVFRGSSCYVATPVWVLWGLQGVPPILKDDSARIQP